MNLRLAGEVTIKRVAGLADDAVPVSDISIHGTSTGKKISAALLEATVQWRDKYLLLTTDDCLFEEFLGIELLDNRLNFLDRARIGLPYNTGIFSSLELRDPNIVCFRFLGDAIWRIELLSSPGFRMPIFSEPRGVWRKFGFRRHFVVHESPTSG